METIATEVIEDPATIDGENDLLLPYALRTSHGVDYVPTIDSLGRGPQKAVLKDQVPRMS